MATSLAAMLPLEMFHDGNCSQLCGSENGEDYKSTIPSPTIRHGLEEESTEGSDAEELQLPQSPALEQAEMVLGGSKIEVTISIVDGQSRVRVLREGQMIGGATRSFADWCDLHRSIRVLHSRRGFLGFLLNICPWQRADAATRFPSSVGELSLHLYLANLHPSLADESVAAVESFLGVH